MATKDKPGTLPEAEKLRAAIREAYPGGCKMFSVGSACECLLCALDNLIILARAEGAAQERARIVADIRKRWDGHEALLILDMLEATRTPPPPEAQE
jgi:hypothetical protein